jgi:hypothetical protein
MSVALPRWSAPRETFPSHRSTPRLNDPPGFFQLKLPDQCRRFVRIRNFRQSCESRPRHPRRPEIRRPTWRRMIRCFGEIGVRASTCTAPPPPCFASALRGQETVGS